MEIAKVAATQVVSLAVGFREQLLAEAEKDKDWNQIRSAVLAKDPNIALEYDVKEDILCYQNRWVVPIGAPLRLAILAENHDSKVAGHFGQ